MNVSAGAAIPTTAPPPARLVLVEDHPMLSKGFKQFISVRQDIRLVGESTTGKGALELLENITADLLVLDVHLPDMNGLEVAKSILQKWPTTRILMFSGDQNPGLVEAALKMGIHGYVLKSTALEELYQAFAAILAGKLYFSPEVCAGVLEDYRKVLMEDDERSPLLSERDVQLLRLICEGRRSKEIAPELGLNIKSVEAYRSRLMKRLNCDSTAELIRFAVRKGVVDA